MTFFSDVNHQLIEAVHDGVLLLDMEQKVLYASPHYMGLLGYGADELLAHEALQRVHPDDRAQLTQVFRDTVASPGQLFEARYRAMTKSGATVQMHARGRAHPQGIPGLLESPCVLVSVRDVSAEVSTRAQLEASERFYRGILNRFDDVVVVLDAAGQLSYVSPSVQRMLGFTPEQLQGTDGFQLLLPEERRAMQDAFLRSKDTASEGREAECRVRDAFGKIRILAAASSPCGPELGGAVLVRFRDVTQARLSDEALLRSERLALLSELLAGVSHELRNPLLAVSANAELLASSPALDADDRESAEAIQQQVRRLRQLLDQALNASLDPPAEALAVQTLLEQSLQQARRRFGPLAIKVRCDIEVDPACPNLLAQPGRLQLALANVALNAFQALPETGGLLKLSAVPDHGGVLISVVDNGPGVPGNAMPELFDPFFTTRPTASGLGLSTAKRIMEAHQGRLWAQRAEPGLAVHAWLPAAP